MEDWVPLGKASKHRETDRPWVQAGISEGREKVYVWFLDGFGDIRLVLDPDDADSLGRLLLSNAQNCLDPDDPDEADRMRRCPMCWAEQ